LTPEAEREGKKYSIVQGENGRHDVTDLEWRTVRTLQDVEEMLDSAQRNKADVFKSPEIYEFLKKRHCPGTGATTSRASSGARCAVSRVTRQDVLKKQIWDVVVREALQGRYTRALRFDFFIY
jgi:hypothetical protein